MKFHIHKYSKWSDPVETYNSGNKQQWRCCTVCNKADFSTLWWDRQTSLVTVLAALRSVALKEETK